MENYTIESNKYLLYYMDSEGLTGSKIGWYRECLKGGLGEKMPYRPGEFSRITPNNIRRYFGDKIEGLLVDVDDCIAPAYGNILPENQDKIGELLDAGFQIGVLSNGINLKERVQGLLDMGVILCSPSVSKPNPQAFLEASQQIEIHPNQVLMIGDDISKDGGALQFNHKKPVIAGYIPVKPIGNSILHIPPAKIINYYLGKIPSRWIANGRNGL